MLIKTSRLSLRCWQDSDRPAFAALYADPAVMADYGGPASHAAADAKIDRYAAAFREHGFCRWVVEDGTGDFLGYAGLMPETGEQFLGPHFSIGWRLKRAAWGRGYATEAARAALLDGFARIGLTEVLAYTARDNLRSQAVMDRLGLQRDAPRDFTTTFDGLGAWHGLVWVARPSN